MIGCSKHPSSVTCLSQLQLKHLLNQWFKVTVIAGFTLTVTHTGISEVACNVAVILDFTAFTVIALTLAARVKSDSEQ